VNAAEITAICTGVPAIVSAVIALIVATRANGSTQAQLKALTNHLIDESAHQAPKL
jgi:hypothetical protein